MSRELTTVWMVLPVLERGGAERVVAELVPRLPARGFEPTVVCLENESAPLGRELSEAGVRVIGLNKSRRNSVGCARKLAEMIRAEQPPLVNAHLFHANFAARLAKMLIVRKDPGFALKVVTTIHVQERRFRPWQFFFDHLTSSWGDLEIGVSPSVVRFQHERSAIPMKFFRTIENGIDLRRFKEPSPKERLELRRKLGLDPKRLLVLAVGRLDPQKNHKLLLEAWRRAAPKSADLWIAGDGPLKASLQKRCLPNARLLGYRQDVPDLMAACDLFVQPSAWEGQPLTVLEAMASGCCVAASEIDSHKDIFLESKAGVLVRAGDPDHWARALKELIDDAPRRATLGAAAAEEARDHFGADRMADDYARAFEDILTGRKPL
ncbi:MAG: glycosyltransferase [Planctomycetota bacterium]|nr:glycosyltransferase [Planctomycetota bacterium]